MKLSTLILHNLEYHNLAPFSLTVTGPEIIGLSGPSGSGKTLLLRAVADLQPHTGKVRLDDTEMQSIKAHLWRRQVGLLPAESQWWFDTVRQHFAELPDRWLERLGFSPQVYDWNTSRLSSGEKQRLALLRLLAIQPRVLLLDEPTANLDRKHSRTVEELIKTYSIEHRSPVLWVSHDMEQLGRVADRIYVIKNDRWVEEKK